MKLVHKSGGVSCNFASRGFLSNWGCDLGLDSSLGTFVTTDCANGCDDTHIVAPPASRMLDPSTWWYAPYAANWAEAPELIFEEDHDATHPQGNFAAGNYQLWYGEDLSPTGQGPFFPLFFCDFQ